MKQKGKLRGAFLWVHRWLGLLSGLVVLVVALTGCLYVWEEEWREAFQEKYLHVDKAGDSRRGITEMLAVVQKAYPKEKITQVRFNEAPDAALLFQTKSELSISVDPYTAAVIGHRDMKTDFMSVVLDLHRHLLLGEVGEQIVRWNVLIFFIMCVSGLVLWWPKQKRFLRQALSIKWRARSWKRLNWDLHSVLGFYALGVLLVISLTGLFWVFDWAKSTVSLATGAPVWKAPKFVNRDSTAAMPAGAIDSAYQWTAAAHPGAKQSFITLPKESKEPLRVLMRYPYSIVRRQTTVWYDAHTLEHLRTDAWQGYSRYEKVSRSVYDFHTGRIRALGWGSKLVYFLASLFAASLPVTGFLVWWSRRKKKGYRPLKEKLKKKDAAGDGKCSLNERKNREYTLEVFLNPL